MAGHSHWKQVKQKKGAEDQKKARIFSKLLTAIAIAAREEPNPQFNPRLRAAIEKARSMNVPQNNIDRAVHHSLKNAEKLEEIILEVYGPGGAALLITAATDNRNRTVSEVRHLLKEFGVKLADPGSVRWAFEETPEKEWVVKFEQKISPDEREKLELIRSALEDRADIQTIYSNATYS